MSKIRVLPEILAGKIAAGEVVERPASVVKELLENSIDAGARAIEVAVEAGGKRSIRVTDDGDGMTQDDAILAFEHHATSKIACATDLESIATLGFRGEALPSVASVARLHLRTRAAGAEGLAGTEIFVEGGVLRSVKSATWERGTEVAVRDLFYNVPARRKFLRAHETEMAHITRLLTHYALAHPALRLTLTSDGRRVLDLEPAPRLRERVYQVFGEAFLDRLAELSGAAGAARVSGFASHPSEQRTNTYSQFFYVNRRVVRDRVLQSAVRVAYRHAIPAGAYPIVLLFVELPFDQVDVNAHPTKLEIRFRDSNLVHELVRSSIQRGLALDPSIPAYQVRTPPPVETPLTDATGCAPYTPGDGRDSAVAEPLLSAFAGASAAAVAAGAAASQAALAFAAPSASAASLFPPGGIRILGQIQESYIVGADRDGLLVIDQHVAHERVLYERNADSLRSRAVETQRLVVPLAVELLPHQRVVAERILAELERNGFELEGFGGDALLVRSVPTMVKDQDCRRLLKELIEDLEREERSLDLEALRERLAASLACRAAIKVHMPLTIEKMQWLIDELQRTRVPTHCPHGRPILLRLSLYDIEKNFRRI